MSPGDKGTGSALAEGQAPTTAPAPRGGAAAVLASLRRDRVALLSLIFLVVLLIAAALSPILAAERAVKINLAHDLLPPALLPGGDWSYPLGTDQLGRDMLARIILGARVSMLVGITVVFLAGLVGTAVGLLAGYHRGWVETFTMRFVDVGLAFPGLLIALVVLGLLGSGALAMIIVLTLINWIVFARIVRDMALSVTEMTFVEAAETMGCSPRRIMFRYLLPQILPLLLTVSLLEFARVVLAEASLSYLGFGIQPPTTSWGLMVAQGQTYATSAWWLVALPGLALAMTVLSTNLLGNWLNRALDPQQGGPEGLATVEIGGLHENL